MTPTIRMGLMEATTEFSAVLTHLREDTRVILTYDGRDIGVMLPLRDLHLLEGLEALATKVVERRGG